MSDNNALIKIIRTDDTGKFTKYLKMSPEEFDKVISAYGTGKESMLHSVPFVKEAKRIYEDTGTSTELELELYHLSDTDCFQNSLAILGTWLKELLDITLKHDRCRAVIEYDAAVRKTTFAIYTPKEYEQSGNRMESPTHSF